MALRADEIEKLICESIPDAKVTLNDLAGDGNHYAAEVISAAFIGRSKIEQHRMVYDSFKGKMGGELHALALVTKPSHD